MIKLIYKIISLAILIFFFCPLISQSVTVKIVDEEIGPGDRTEVIVTVKNAVPGSKLEITGIKTEGVVYFDNFSITIPEDYDPQDGPYIETRPITALARKDLEPGKHMYIIEGKAVTFEEAPKSKDVPGHELSHEQQSEKEPKEPDTTGVCEVELNVIHPKYSNYDMITNHKFENKKQKADFEKGIKNAINNKTQKVVGDEIKGAFEAQVGASSAIAFYKDQAIGGQVHAAAKTNAGGQYISSTERMSPKAAGSKMITMQFLPPENCDAFIVGVSYASIKANTTVFDPLDGYELAGQIINSVGNFAFEYLKAARGGGMKTKEDLVKFIRGKVEGAIEDQTSGPIEEEIRNKTEAEIIDLTEEFLGVDNLDQVLTDYEKIKKWATLDLSMEDFVTTASDTYSQCKGEIELSVGSNSETVTALSSSIYRREAFEDSNEAVKMSGPDLNEILVSGSGDNYLSITITGKSEILGAAKGNGTTRGKLGSYTNALLYGVCECPFNDDKNQLIKKEYSFNMGYYLGDFFISKVMNEGDNKELNIFKPIFDKLDEFVDDPANRNKESVEKELVRLMSEWKKTNEVEWSF